MKLLQFLLSKNDQPNRNHPQLPLGARLNSDDRLGSRLGVWASASPHLGDSVRAKSPKTSWPRFAKVTYTAQRSFQVLRCAANKRRFQPYGASVSTVLCLSIGVEGSPAMLTRSWVFIQLNGTSRRRQTDRSRPLPQVSARNSRLAGLVDHYQAHRYEYKSLICLPQQICRSIASCC